MVAALEELKSFYPNLRMVSIGQIDYSRDRSGWMCKPDGTYGIEWEAAEAQAEIQLTIDSLLKGCNCKNGCKSNIRGCQKKKFLWIWMSVSVCQGCTNSPATHDNSDLDDDSTSTKSTTALDGLICDDILAEEIITDDFNFEIGYLN